MADHLLNAEDRLLELLAQSARGPKRNGVFALWMLVRVCDGVLPPDSLSLRAHRRRLAGLERRLTSLSMPAPLRRALTSAVREVSEGDGTAAARALHRLVAPAREALGSDAAEAVSLAARAAHAATVGGGV